MSLNVGGDNERQAQRWERYFLALLFAVVSALSTWAWGLQAHVTALQQESDRRMQTLSLFEELRKGQEPRAIQLAVLEHEMRIVKGRLDTMALRMLSLARRVEHPPQASGALVDDTLE